MRVAVTGATGFVGRHVIAALLARGVQVTGAARSPERIHISHSRLTMISMDISDAEDAFVRLGKPDILIHLAWGGLPNYRSMAHLQHELPNQIAFLDECSRAGLGRLVVTGTCLEYGMQAGRLAEDMPTAPITAYGHAKDLLREHLESANGGPQLTWLRLFYLYGQGQAPTSLFSQLRNALATGAKEFPMSAGDQERDFLSVESAAARLTALALDSPGAGTVNLCSGNPKPVVLLVREWLQEWNEQIQLKLGVFPYPDYEPHTFWGSTQKLDALLEAT